MISIPTAKHTENKNVLIKYIVVGISGVILDALLYLALYKYFDFSINLSKGIGVFMAVVYGYLINAMWSFQAKYTLSNFMSYLVIYGISTCVNITTNSFIARMGDYTTFFLVLAFLTATAVSIIINFTGLKLWVFRK